MWAAPTPQMLLPATTWFPTGDSSGSPIPLVGVRSTSGRAGAVNTGRSSTSRYRSTVSRQPSKVWIEICERAAAPLNLAMVHEMLVILRQRAPSATYYISPLNSYSPSNICAITGPNGVADATNLANEAVSKGLALAGPTIGPLTSQNTVTDLCHPNTGGESLLGSQLASFFGG